MINKLKNGQRLIKKRMKLLKSKSPFRKNDLNDKSIKLESLMAKINSSNNKVLELENATVSYNPELDKVIFTIISKSPQLGKIEVEIDRNSHEDREFRKMLLGKGLISDEESAALPVRRIIPKFLSTEDMPDPLYDDAYTLGQGERGKEIVWESSLYPHMFIVGRAGTGKTNLTRNLLSYAFHKTNSHVYEIDLSIEDPNPRTLYRNMSRGCKTTIDDALGVITLFHSKMNSCYKTGNSNHHDEILLIENLDLILPAIWIRPEDELDINLEKKQKIQKMLAEIIEFGDSVKNMHLVCSTSARSFDQLLPFKNKEQVCYVSLGRISPEDSHYLFNDNGGYFVSPYIKGRGYIRFGTKSGIEFQSYFIEDDYLNHIAYVQQLGIHR